MKNYVKISVCMAIYNGEKYLEKQIFSILNQLRDDDELIIVDDMSIDNSLDVVNSFIDKRIKIIRLKNNVGHVKAFERAIIESKGEIVFLSDQDDIWIPGRLNLMIDKLLSSDKLIVCSNFLLIDSSDNNLFNFIKPISIKYNKNYIKNIFGIFFGERSYYGCVMAFRRQLINYCFPAPDFVESHDIWIAIFGNLNNSVLHINDITLNHRIHLHNATTSGRGFIKVIRSRLFFIKAVFYFLKRLNRE